MRDTTGIVDRGMRIEGQLTNLGEPTVSLDVNNRKMRGTGKSRDLALDEPHLLDDELLETAGHKQTAATRYWEGSESEPTRDGQRRS